MLYWKVNQINFSQQQSLEGLYAWIGFLNNGYLEEHESDMYLCGNIYFKCSEAVNNKYKYFHFM